MLSETFSAILETVRTVPPSTNLYVFGTSSTQDKRPALWSTIRKLATDKATTVNFFTTPKASRVQTREIHEESNATYHPKGVIHSKKRPTRENVYNRYLADGTGGLNIEADEDVSKIISTDDWYSLMQDNYMTGKDKYERDVEVNE